MYMNPNLGQFVDYAEHNTETVPACIFIRRCGRSHCIIVFQKRIGAHPGGLHDAQKTGTHFSIRITSECNHIM